MLLKKPIFLHYTINPPLEVAVGAQLQDLENGLYVTKPFATHIQSLEWQFEEKPIFTMANDNILCPKCNYYMKIKLNNNIHKSPTSFGKTVVWIKLYEYYKYYYNKYAQKI